VFGRFNTSSDHPSYSIGSGGNYEDEIEDTYPFSEDAF